MLEPRIITRFTPRWRSARCRAALPRAHPKLRRGGQRRYLSTPCDQRQRDRVMLHHQRMRAHRCAALQRRVRLGWNVQPESVPFGHRCVLFRVIVHPHHIRSLRRTQHPVCRRGYRVQSSWQSRCSLLHGRLQPIRRLPRRDRAGCLRLPQRVLRQLPAGRSRRWGRNGSGCLRFPDRVLLRCVLSWRVCVSPNTHDFPSDRA